MYTVLLDSSNTLLCVGLAKENKLIASTIYEAWQEQSEHMIPELDKLLSSFNVDKKDIDSVMVAIGPGSYTGVRISLTIAKVMSLALKIPLYPVSSLRILKFNEKPSICCVNARSNRSYVGMYEGDKILLEDTIMNNDELKLLIEHNPSFTLCGNTKYLNLEGYEGNSLEEMISLKDSLIPLEDAMGLKPVYLKD